MGERTSVYLATDLRDAVKASGVPLAGLVRRGLAAGAGDLKQPAPCPAAPSLAGIPECEPSRGAICIGPAAGNAIRRSTASARSRSAPPAAQPSKAALTSGTCPRVRRPHAPRRGLIRPPPPCSALSRRSLPGAEENEP